MVKINEDSWMGQLITTYKKILNPQYDVATLDKANDIVCDALEKMRTLFAEQMIKH